LETTPCGLLSKWLPTPFIPWWFGSGAAVLIHLGGPFVWRPKRKRAAGDKAALNFKKPLAFGE